MSAAAGLDKSLTELESGTLARETVAAFRGLVECYKEHYRLSAPEALERAREPNPAGEEHARRAPPDQVSWLDLHQLGERDPEAALRRWQEVKQAALEELQSGHRAAQAVEVNTLGTCWQRVQFLALRDDLAAGWQPRNGFERQLIDALAQAQAAYLHWLNLLAVRTGLEAAEARRLTQETGRWDPPRLSDAAAVDQAAQMVDRFNRIALRTLRALRDLRRYAPVVVVQNAGQVNIGERQVNVGAAEPSAERPASAALAG